MDPIKEFQEDRKARITRQGENVQIKKTGLDFTAQSMRSQYSYNFSWMGRPIIQYPQDMIAMQELIWEVQPDLIIETGIAHGGSLIYYASLLELIGKDAYVLGVDIDIRDHNRTEIEAHQTFNRIEMIQGSSIDKSVVAEVAKHADGKNRILVTLDSNHTHDHVLEELHLYAPFVTKNSYLVVFDTSVEFAPDDLNADRPWSVGNNPKTAVDTFLTESDRFTIVDSIDKKLLISMAPGGYLKCLKD
nr:cephalosporin hydroxylase family protein [uncultured Pseudodesulfovibrio sp.]